MPPDMPCCFHPFGSVHLSAFAPDGTGGVATSPAGGETMPPIGVGIAAGAACSFGTWKWDTSSRVQPVADESAATKTIASHGCFELMEDRPRTHGGRLDYV